MTHIQATMDKMAIDLSVVCTIHCLLLIGVLSASMLALALGCKKHKKWDNAFLGCVGLSALIFAGFFGHDYAGKIREKVRTIIAIALISMTHFRNYKLCSLNQCEH